MLERHHPAAGLLTPGHHGAPGQAPVRLSAPMADIVQLAARRDGAATTTAAIAAAFGLTLPPAGHAAASGDISALWIQPDAWLMVAPSAGEGALAARIKAATGQAAAVVDQSHGRCLLAIEGAQAATVLSRLCRVDLHPRAFAPGQVAVTPLADLSCVLQRMAPDRFVLILPATYIGSAVALLQQAAAPVGYIVD